MGMADAAGLAGHPHGPGRTMSVTKLKTVGSWHTAWQDSTATGTRANVRGRVITGLLTGGDPPADTVTVAGEPRKQR
jgi:hypothetical protein